MASCDYVGALESVEKEADAVSSSSSEAPEDEEEAPLSEEVEGID